MQAKIPQIDWNEIYSHSFSRSLNSLMLERDVVFVTSCRSLLNSSSKKLYQVVCNRDYMFSFIIKKVIKALVIKDKQSALDLMAQAWDYYENSWQENNESN